MSRTPGGAEIKLPSHEEAISAGRHHVPSAFPDMSCQSTCGRDAEPRSDLGDRRHQEVSMASGVPSNAAICFCSSTSASARSARFRQWVFSRLSSVIRLSRGSATRRTGPRFFARSGGAFRRPLAGNRQPSTLATPHTSRLRGLLFNENGRGTAGAELPRAAALGPWPARLVEMPLRWLQRRV